MASSSSSSYNLMHRLRQQGHSTLSRFQAWRTRQTLTPPGLTLSLTVPPRRFRRQRESQGLSSTLADWHSSAIPASSAPRDPLSVGGKAPHPFLPFLHPVSRRWRPASISHRREAELVNEAFRKGELDVIPDESAKKMRLLARLTRGREIAGWTEDWRKRKNPTSPAVADASAAAAAAAASHQAASPAATTSPTTSASSSSPPFKTATFSRAAIKSHQESILLHLAEAGYGPLQGRNAKIRGMQRFFKGTKGERTRKGKDAKILSNLEQMEQDVAQWRQTKKEAAAKNIPSQPF